MLADLRFALRQLLKTPGFTLVALFTLALGIGATTAIFSVVNTVLLRPLEYRNPDELVTVWSFNPKRARRYQVSGPDFRDWQEQCRSFGSVARFSSADVSTVVGDHAAERTSLAGVSADFFRVLDVSPRAGRVFTADEAVSGTVAIVGEAFARRHFPGDPAAALDATIQVRGAPLRIIGVIPAGFTFPDRTDIWVPLNTLFGESPSRSAHNYRVIARLAPGATLQRAQAEMDGLATRIAEQYPDSNTNKGVQLVLLRDLLTEHHKHTLWTVLGAVALVLLIACANVANLLLVRGARRRHEIALRAALGASRTRIARQLLSESLLLALFGGVAGVLLAKAALIALLALAPAGLPRVEEIGLDGGTLAFAVLISFLVCALTGLFPVLQAARVDLNTAPHAGGRGVAGSRNRMRNALVVAQLAVSLVLLAGARLLLRSLQLLLAIDPGYRPGHVLVMKASFPAAGRDGATQAVAF